MPDPNAARSPIGRIDWARPGRPDFFVGTGATPGERALAWTATLGLPALIYLTAWRGAGLDWALWQWALALVVAADVAGGVVANALNAQKRYAHGPLRPADAGLHRLLKQRPLVFPLVHIHAAVVAAAFGGTTLYAAVWYPSLLAACWAVTRLPVHLRRPAAYLAVAAAILANEALVAPPPGFAWLAPFLALKLVAGHAVPEEPYAPPRG